MLFSLRRKKNKKSIHEIGSPKEHIKFLLLFLVFIWNFLIYSLICMFFLTVCEKFTSVVLFMNWLIWTCEICLYKGTSLTTWLMHPGSTKLFCLLCNWYLQLDKNTMVKLPQVFCEINKCQRFRKDLSILSPVKVTSVH